MRILVYRRTHTGDPDGEHKEFGYHDCMGSVRDRDYDAVIGIGGKRPWPGDAGIKERVTWVGNGRKDRWEATPLDLGRLVSAQRSSITGSSLRMPYQRQRSAVALPRA